MSIERDPVTNAIYNGIKRGIRTALDAECYGSAVVLLYAAMDAMASLGRPPENQQVTPQNFIGWADRYISLEGDTEISGEEWYSARCAVLHTYGVESRRTRVGDARQIGYMVEGRPAVRFNPDVSRGFVIVDIPALAEAFFEGVDQFLVAVFADENLAPVIEERAQKLLTEIPYSEARLDSE